MPDTETQTEASALSVHEMQKLQMLCANIDWPPSFQQLSEEDRECVLKAGTRLFTSDNELYEVQRDLLGVIAMTTLCARLRKYCVAVVELYRWEWDCFAQCYCVPEGGGPRLARAHTAFVELFPAQY